MKNYLKKCTLFILGLIYFNPFNAQINFTSWDSIVITENADTLLYPFAGGFNNPQFSDIDLNGDGLKDIFVFDRSTSRTFTFINKGIPNQSSYYYDPSYRSAFPKMQEWALLEDYNCDGKEDLFTYDNFSFKVYRNDYSSSTGLKFTFLKSFPDSFIYIGPTDIPSFIDVDNDGDLDLLTFESAGFVMYYFQNTSIDNYGTCDSLNFVLNNHCWGNFSESFGSCAVTLASTCKGGKQHKKEKHAGSTTLALDLDGDGDKEVIIGDLTCTNTYMLTNGGSPAVADMIAYDSLYPIMDPVNILYFPAAFSLDINNDGLNDLIAAPNAINFSENFNSATYYENIGTSSVANFDIRTNRFLQGEMLEIGEGANPTFFDYNGDSLLDIVIGNYGYFSATSATYPSGLALYENIGTTQNPSFKLITRDYLGLQALNLNGIYPTFGDIDSDGDKDLIIGDFNGNIHLYTNTAGAGNIASFVLTQPFYKGIDVGQFATPQLIDVNLDGKIDLLIGERSGNINYFENTGTSTLANFNSTPTNDFFGGIDILVPCCTGYSSPFLTRLDSSGKYSLLVGTENGTIYQYDSIEGNLNGSFNLIDTTFQNIFEGIRSSISGGDLNNNGKIDLVVGNYGGGLRIYKNLGATPPQIIPKIDTLSFSINIFPNPTSNNLTIHINGLLATEGIQIQIYNVIGQQIYSAKFNAIFNNWNLPISLAQFTNGVYVVKIVALSSRKLSSKNSIKKFILDR